MSQRDFASSLKRRSSSRLGASEADLGTLQWKLGRECRRFGAVTNARGCHCRGPNPKQVLAPSTPPYPTTQKLWFNSDALLLKEKVRTGTPAPTHSP